MEVRAIYRAWIVLIGLSFATTALTLIGRDNGSIAVGGALLALAGAKARTILSRYLELRHSAFWMRTFDMAIGLFLIAAFGLYVAGAGRSG